MSRKAILDKSINYPKVMDEEDVWFSTSKLFLVSNVKDVINYFNKKMICRIT